MSRLIYLMIVAVILIGIVHIVIVLQVPSFAAKDAWANLTNAAKKSEFTIVSTPGERESIVASVDPAMGVAACLFDLNDGPLRVDAQGALPFWSVAVFDRRGENIYSFNDRTAIERRLVLFVVNPVQRAQLRKTPVEGLEEALIIEATAREGFVLLRALQTDESFAPAVNEFLTKASCRTFSVDPEAAPPSS